MLKVVWSSVEELWFVVNTFDGVIVDKFLAEADADDFAWAEEINEQHRIYNEYG